MIAYAVAWALLKAYSAKAAISSKMALAVAYGTPFAMAPGTAGELSEASFP